MPKPGAVFRGWIASAWFVSLALFISAAALTSAAAPAQSGSVPTSPRSARAGGYETPLRNESQLATTLTNVCQLSRAQERPMLVEFSAPWCSDCQLLHRMKRAASLAAELSRWPVVVINVGRFDQHPALLEALDVRSIARWTILEPSDCNSPIEDWPRLAERTLEPDSGEARSVSPDDLADWLAGFRNPEQDPDETP